MEETKVLYKVYLNSSKHARTGNTIHSKDGYIIQELPKLLQIEANPWVDEEYYLIHYDKNGNDMSDTLHDSVEEAMKQARFEFNIEEQEWINVDEA